MTPRERQAYQFLIDFLSNGERAIDSLRLTAEADGLSMSILRRVADQIGVIRYQHDGRTWWRLK